MKYFGLLILSILAACKTDLNIQKDQVEKTLLEYGAQNPEKNVTITTDFGKIELKLYEDTPLHRANFIRTIKSGHYDSPEFYRIVSSFMIQGGDLDAKKTNFLVPNEVKAHHFHQAGALAMAHYDENNPQKNSSPTEFYIVKGRKYLSDDLQDLVKLGKYTPQQISTFETIGGAANLDGNYTVFGELTSGMEVVEKIAALRTNDNESPKQKVKFKISCH